MVHRPAPPTKPAGCTMRAGQADVAEQAYALDSKSSDRKVMRVQLPPSAPILLPDSTAPDSCSDRAWKPSHLAGSRRNPAEMGTPMGTPGGRRRGGSLESMRLADRQKDGGPPSMARKRAGVLPFKRAETPLRLIYLGRGQEPTLAIGATDDQHTSIVEQDARRISAR
jgi:hypothetical protein